MDLTGQKFGKWTVIERVVSNTCQPKFLCRCECGTERIIASQNLRKGNTTSCGCDRKKYIDLTGQRFGRLVAVRRVENNHKWGFVNFLCKCDCGNEKIVGGYALRQGKALSCGCLMIENIKKANTKHGNSRSRLYNIWHGMKQRCYDKNLSNYPCYGGRGITVCDEWQEFEPFYDWAMANGYKEEILPNGKNKWTIDRIDNDKGYSPDNCRWADFETQNANKRPPQEWREKGVFVEINGITKNLISWCKEYGLNYNTVMTRVHIRKWDWVRAITTPLQDNKSRIVEYKGETLTVAEMAQRHNVRRDMVLYRLRNGWTVEEAIETPAGQKRNQKSV